MIRLFTIWSALVLAAYLNVYSQNWNYSPLSLVAVIVSFASIILYCIQSYRVIILSGYKPTIGFLTIASFIACIYPSYWNCFFHIIFVVLLSRNASKEKRPSIALLFLVIFPFLQYFVYDNGFRIYGHAHLYYPKPKASENWQRVVAWQFPDELITERSSKISIAPFEFNKELSEQSFEQALNSTLFPDHQKIWVRKLDNQSDWRVRYHDKILCSSATMFPSRTNGVLYDNLMDFLFSPIVNESLIEWNEQSIEWYKLRKNERNH